MAFIERFLGVCVEVPDDHFYCTKPGLWAKADGQEIIFGLSHPALVLAGGLNDLDWLVPQGHSVREGETVLFAITGKILYIDSPVEGTIHFNTDVKGSPALISKYPYGQGWLFRIRPHLEPARVLEGLVDASGYIESLKGTEGDKNPEGLKGGVSGICKAVYTGIREQKI
ncbi:MAG: hypothetical protein V1689_14790 [Pseudomonadota bacterium]